MTFFSGLRRKKAKQKPLRERAQGKSTRGEVFADRRSVPFPVCPANAPQHVKDQYEALKIIDGNRRQELAVLRETRGKRQVGTVKVPVHLQAGEVLDDTSRVIDPRTNRPVVVRPEKRGDARGDILPE